MTSAVKSLVLVLGVLVVSSCALEKQSMPGLAGPSTFGVSLAVTATPDLVARNGSAQSTVTVVARDANSQPVKNLELRFDIKLSGVLGDLGFLSNRNRFTESDGTTRVTYFAPGPALFGAPNEATIQVVVTPLGTDYANTVATAVSIFLTSPGAIQPPIPAPVASFVASPTNPRVLETVSFNGSASSAPPGRQIQTWAWDFGDGEFKNGPTTTHDYILARTYTVTLTVTDDTGRTNSISRTLTINP